MNNFEYKMEAEKLINNLKERVAELEKQLNASEVLNYNKGHADGRNLALPTKPLNGWIPVSERLPEDLQTVAFVVKARDDEYLHGRVLGGIYQSGVMSCFSVPGLGVCASHWMPLPEAPIEVLATK